MQPQFSDTDAAELCGPEMKTAQQEGGYHGSGHHDAMHKRAIDQRRNSYAMRLSGTRRSLTFWTFNMDERQCQSVTISCYVGYYQRTMFNLFKSRHDCEKSCMGELHEFVRRVVWVSCMRL